MPCGKWSRAGGGHQESCRVKLLYRGILKASGLFSAGPQLYVTWKKKNCKLNKSKVGRIKNY